MKNGGSGSGTLAGVLGAYLMYFPGFAIVLTLLCINFLGDGLRDAFDPQSTH